MAFTCYLGRAVTRRTLDNSTFTLRRASRVLACGNPAFWLIWRAKENKPGMG